MQSYNSVASNIKKCSLQAYITKALLHKHITQDFAHSIHQRLYKFSALLAVLPETLIRMIQTTIEASKNIAPAVSIAIAKTWANGWVTDTRFGAKESKCRLGCHTEDPNARDRLKHYLDCPRLWRFVCGHYQDHTQIPVESTRFDMLCLIPPWIDADPSRAPIRNRALCLYVACDVYQTISNEQKTQQAKPHGDHSIDTTSIELIHNHINESFNRLQRFTTLPKGRHLVSPPSQTEQTTTEYPQLPRQPEAQQALYSAGGDFYSTAGQLCD